ncbi:MAG: exodeoxyribonuclease VII small subunit [Gammaproteobacteria bacterium]|nr:exodeoxyribonuclease VII small subunit [Gammaproteobacteria bacterium]
MPKKSAKKSATKASPESFETALAELEQLVEKMEKGDLSLEESMTDFQRGIELTKHCQATLKAAEQKVQILVEQGNSGKLAPFDAED